MRGIKIGKKGIFRVVYEFRERTSRRGMNVKTCKYAMLYNLKIYRSFLSYNIIIL